MIVKFGIKVVMIREFITIRVKLRGFDFTLFNTIGILDNILLRFDIFIIIRL